MSPLELGGTNNSAHPIISRSRPLSTSAMLPCECSSACAVCLHLDVHPGWVHKHTSAGKLVMCAGILFPVRNCDTSSEKLLQLLFRRLYVPALYLCSVSSSKYSSKTSFGMYVTPSCNNGVVTQRDKLLSVCAANPLRRVYDAIHVPRATCANQSIRIVWYCRGIPYGYCMQTVYGGFKVG